MSKKSKKVGQKKICFIIGPIGSPESDVRRRVDQWSELIYKSAIGTGYEIVRADNIAAPGLITEQILDHILDDDLAIIDYTGERYESGPNPNVMYEAAIRHITKKPFIQIYPNGQKVPFDINNWRSIRYDPLDLEYPKKLVKDIKNAIKEVEHPDYKVPELLKHQFDLGRITSDPEKFVVLLKKNFIGSGSAQQSLQAATIHRVGWGNIDFLGMKRIVCPKCGVIKSNDYVFGKSVGYYVDTYKCDNCGTEFEVK